MNIIIWDENDLVSRLHREGICVVSLLELYKFNFTIDEFFALDA